MKQTILWLEEQKQVLEKALNYGRKNPITFDEENWEEVDDLIDSYQVDNRYIV